MIQSLNLDLSTEGATGLTV